MKTYSAFLTSGRLLTTLLLLGSAGTLRAQNYTYPNTITVGNASWIPSDNIVPIVTTPGNGGSGGFGLSDAYFANAGSGLDAFDSAFAMGINGTLFAPSSSAATYANNTLNSGLATFQNYTAQAQFTFYQSMPIVRGLYTFHNTSASPVTLRLNWQVNLGSDNNTTIRGTSSGGSGMVANGDRWFVSSDTGQGGAIDTVVRFGQFAPNTPTGQLLPANGADLLSDQYFLTLGAAGSGTDTLNLLMFAELGDISGGLNAGNTAALANASIFNNFDTLGANGLTNGLPALSDIVNWGAVPEPSPLILLAGGLAGLFLLRRFLGKTA
jgi:hypothetical protein